MEATLKGLGIALIVLIVIGGIILLVPTNEDRELRQLEDAIFALESDKTPLIDELAKLTDEKMQLEARIRQVQLSLKEIDDNIRSLEKRRLDLDLGDG